MILNGQTEPKQGVALFWATRRRTRVRRAAKFVRSKKVKNPEKSNHMKFFIQMQTVYE